VLRGGEIATVWLGERIGEWREESFDEGWQTEQKGELCCYVCVPTPLYWRPFLHPQPEDVLCLGDRDPLIMEINTEGKEIAEC
jgi:hypothetical protein